MSPYFSICNWFYYVDTATLTCTALPHIRLASDIILIVLRSFLPLTIMLVLNSIVIHRLQRPERRQAKRRRSGTCSQAVSRDRRFSVTVLLMNLAFAIFNLPITLVYIVRHAYTDSWWLDRKAPPSRLLLAKLDLAWSLSFNLTSLYYVLFAFLHMYFNKLFRREVMEILRRGRPKRVFAMKARPVVNIDISYKSTSF
jgi:ABC-type sulfate transport system permease subunit